MRVNIRVTDNDMNWIVGRYAKELVKHLPKYGVEAAINHFQGADLEYHANTYFRPSKRPAVGLFAHNRFELAPHFDGHIALNPEYRETLRSFGAPNPVVIEQAVDERFVENIQFGVAGSVKGDNRKGQDLVQKMLDHDYNITAWGTGWPCPIVSDNYAHLPGFFASLDYYVVTSRIEGGCTPIIECMAMGVPVISPRIGFAIVRPVIEYQAGNWESLHSVLRYLTEHKTYDDFARDHADYFQTVLQRT
jgi:hypothetical protein